MRLRWKTPNLKIVKQIARAMENLLYSHESRKRTYAVDIYVERRDATKIIFWCEFMKAKTKVGEASVICDLSTLELSWGVPLS